MTAWYPTPGFSKVGDILTYANTTTDGYFWMAILLTFYVLSFLTVSRIYGIKTAFTTASWGAALFAMPLWVFGLIGSGLMLLMVLLVAISSIMLYLDR